MKRDFTTLAVASGKGGVGKSVIAVNLAEALAAEGRSVALVDADFAQGACSVLINETPPASVLDLARLDARTDHVIHETITGLTLVQAVADPGSHDDHLPALYSALDDLIRRLRRECEYVLIDTAAGLDGAVRWAIDRADLTALVLVGEPTAISDAYRLAKLVWQTDPTYPLGTIVNYCDTAEEARSVSERFNAVTERFTGQVPSYLGWVPYAKSVRQSVRDQVPVVRTPGPLRDAFTRLGQMLVQGRRPEPEPLHH